MVLENSGFLGYKAADFYDAILGDTNQLKKLEVYEAKISDATKITNTGLGNLAIFTKTQLVTFNGTAKYTVDLSKISKECFFNKSICYNKGKSIALHYSYGMDYVASL